MQSSSEQRPYAFKQKEFDFLMEWKAVDAQIQALKRGNTPEAILALQDRIRETGRAHAGINIWMRRAKRGENRLPIDMQHLIKMYELLQGEASVTAYVAYSPIQLVDISTSEQIWHYQQISLRPTKSGGIDVSHELVDIADGNIVSLQEDFRRPLSHHVNNPRMVRSVLDTIYQRFPAI